MTNKDKHVLGFWYGKLIELVTIEQEPVSSGQLARHVGQSRSTAKKYLLRLVGEGHVERFQTRYPNGLLGDVYAPHSDVILS